VALTHLDAGVLIGFLDADDAHHLAARAVVAEAVDRADRVEMAASALAECLVGPARRGEDAVRLVLDLCQRLPIEIVSIDGEIATAAARLRARHRSLRLPDALVVATATVREADHLVTTDGRWPTSKAMHLRSKVRRL
jgi:predicted nucleic acid-binding protein